MEQREIKLSVNNLKISFRTDGGNVQAVRDISFELYKGETLAIVGESGSGKSVTNRAIMGILAGNAIKEGGEIIYDGQDLMKIDEEQFHRIRGDRIAMIFQDPMSCLNPVMRVGKQLTEAMLVKGRASRRQARKDFDALLKNLNKAMDGVSGKDADEECKRLHGRMCGDFEKFQYKRLALENAYNRAREAAADALAETEDALFRIEKNSFGGLGVVLKNIVHNCDRASDPFVVSERKEELKGLTARLKAKARMTSGKKAAAAVGKIFGKTAKEGCGPAAAKPELLAVRDILAEAVNKVKPDFFAMGYYLTFSGKPLPDACGDMLNRLLVDYLYENFMSDFIAEAGSAARYSHEIALADMRNAISVIDQSLPVFEEKRLNMERAAAAVRRVSAAVSRSKDILETVKDNMTHTFGSSLDEAVARYFRSCRRNAAEEKRYRRKKARIDGEIRRGGTPGYEPPEADLTDADTIREEIRALLLRVRKKYAAQCAEASYDARGKAEETINYLGEKAYAASYKVTRGTAKARAIKLLKEVGISDPGRMYRQYPFELSGGMRQRIVIAIALSADPDILICDEPTTALDVTIQSQILELINRVKKERKLSVIFVTHDLGVVADMADRVAVMYAGKIVETGTADEVFYTPAHPYTWALLASMPDLDTKGKLEAIPGTPPDMTHPPAGDAFAERNRYAMKIDFERQPPMFRITPTHYAATWLLHPDAPKAELPDAVKNRILRRKARS